MATLDEKLGRDKRFSFTSQAVAADTFAVVELQGFEAISKPYEFTLTLVSERADLDLDDLLAKPATLTIHSRLPGQAPIPYHGLLTEFTQLQQVANGWTLYQAALAPRVQRLALHRHSEVYLNMDIPHVIETVLKNVQFFPADYDFRLVRNDYLVLPYVCQFEETYLDFIHRWMEWRGIYYFFEQGKDREKLVFADSRTIHSAARGAVSYRPAEQSDTGTHDEFVQAFICTQKPVPRKVGLKEYDYDTAALEMLGEAEVSPKGQGEVWLYGEHWSNQEWSAKLAEIRAQELSCRAKVFHGESTATGLKAGHLIDLTGHYRGDFNGQYLITDVRHEGSQAGTLLAGLDVAAGSAFSSRQDSYRTTFAAMPGAMQFRSARVTPKPKMNGFINAFVDAEGSGEYAEIDERGRYKVQVPFDKTDKAAGKGSFWIRKASQYSGKDHGLHYPLHKGTEVLLGFENGDPDRPVIMGTVHNSESPNVVTRNNQTQTLLHTAGGNQMQFEDLLGKQHIRFHTLGAATTLRMGVGDSTPPSAPDGFTFDTQKNWTETVGGQKTETITGNKTETVKSDKSVTVSGNVGETIDGKRTVTVGSPSAIYSNAATYIPVPGLSPGVSRGAEGTKAGGTFTSTDSRLVFGGQSDTVLGKSARTVIGIHSDLYAGLSTNIYVAAHADVGPVQVQTYAQHLSMWGNRIKAVGSAISAVGSAIGSFGSWVKAKVSSTEVVENDIRVSGNRIGFAEMSAEDFEVGLQRSSVSVRSRAVDVANSGSRISSIDELLAEEAPISMRRGGVIMFN